MGDRVNCETELGLLPGTVMEMWMCGDFEINHRVPCDVRIDLGHHVFALVDSDEFVKNSRAPAPECWIRLDSKQSEDNIIVRECACRGGAEFVHVDCIVKLAFSKMDSTNIQTRMAIY